MDKTLTYDDFMLGDTTTFSKTISESDIYAFAGITGDFNPIHINAEAARKTPFKGRIAHGILSAGIISAALTLAARGCSSVYCSQTLEFKAPVHINDTITATVTIIDKIPERHRLLFRTTATNQNGTIVTDGQAESSIVP